MPWLLALEGSHSARGALAAGWLMATAYVAAALGWFAPAIADYTGLPAAVALTVWLAGAPMLQPQIIIFALVRTAASRRYAAAPRAAVAIAAWLAVEWIVPRLLGDTLGHGLQPSRLLRQGADLAGAAGLTLVLLVVNEAIATALVSGRRRWSTIGAPVSIAVCLPVVLGAYGAVRLAALRAEPSDESLRIGLVQAAIVDYERLRRKLGAYTVVRQVLDAHFELSRQLVADGAQALVWPETVYPTSFGQPRSPTAGAFDREITTFATMAGVPLVLGTYQRDARAEYNVAAFVDPARGPLGVYRKTRLFPFTEYVPPTLEGPTLRRVLPWAGTWQPGDGARVFPLFLTDGREVPVAPLVCRDDVDPNLARDGVRLGARLLVGMSNDSWFTRAPLGARLHLAAATFRSIETRLPQVRVTTNGLTAVVDPTGEIVAQTDMGRRTALLAEVAPRTPAPTLFVRWGSWLGPVSLLVLAGFACTLLLRLRLRRRRRLPAAADTDIAEWAVLPHRVLLVRPWQRVAIGTLRALARCAVVVLGAAALASDDAPRVVEEVRAFACWVLAPELVAALLAHVCRANLRVHPDQLILESPRQRIEIDRHDVSAFVTWRLPWPLPGFDVVLRSGDRWGHGVAMRRASTALRALAPGVPPRRDHPSEEAVALRAVNQAGEGAADHMRGGLLAGVSPENRVPGNSRDTGAACIGASGSRRFMRLLDALDVKPWRVDAPLLKFVVFPLVPALPAFRLHQVIAYGSPLGEYYTFGAWAYISALLLWWASWAVKLALLAGGLRTVVEATAGIALLVQPNHAPTVRRVLLAGARLAYFAGVPLWLAIRLAGG